MKKIAFIIIIILININTYSQNLVKNPSFEEMKDTYTHEFYCAEHFNKYVSDWLSLALYSAGIYQYDTFHFIKDTSSLQNFPHPHSGKFEAEIHAYGNSSNNDPYRSYIEGRLKKPLIKGRKYYMEFYISVWLKAISNNIGVYFSIKPLPIVKQSMINYKPQFNYTELPPIKENNEWISISWTFTAQDTFKYFTIGNFYSDGNSKIKRFQNNQNCNYTDYFIDDVKIEEVIERDTIKEKNLLNKMELNKPLTLNNIYFETGKSNLLDSSFAELNTLFNILKSKAKMMIQISGYTDNTGNAQDNIVLSEARANAVKKYLTDKGIDNKRIIAKGYGSNNPKASNDNAEGRAKNRRVEIMVLKNE